MSSNGMTKKILIVRNDRLGDTILALPTISLIKEMYPQSEIYFLANPAIAPLINLVEGIKKVITAQDSDSKKIINELKSIDFSIAYCLHPTFENAINLFRAQIPERIGTSRRWYSLAFNRRKNISRRDGNRHEALLNLDLVDSDRQLEHYSFPEIKIPDHQLKLAENLLREKHIKNKKPLVIIHPGSGLSAVNWHALYFKKLTKMLIANKEVDVVITGIVSEFDLCSEVSNNDSVNLCGQTDLIGMSALIKKADLLITNSTGPLHLAIALDCKVIGLYPPKKDCLPIRWGPYGHPDWALMPDLPICNVCKPGKISPCRCLEEITPVSVYDKSVEMLRI